jgi:hypothetical protein
MVPPKTDAKWKKFVTNIGSIEAANLPTRMLLSRLRLRVGANPTEAGRQEVIHSAWEFFSKNETTVADDIKKIFG